MFNPMPAAGGRRESLSRWFTANTAARSPDDSRKNLLRYLAVHVSKPEIAPGVAVGEPLVIES